MRRNLVLVSFSLLLSAGALVAPGLAATVVSGGSLKIDGLSELTKGGKLSLVGFAWEGPAKSFQSGLPSEQLTAGAGDRTFTVASDGPVELCRGLGRLGSRTFDEGRLSFKGAEGPLAALKIEGVSVGTVDCAKSPWTAEFRVAALEPAEQRVKSQDASGAAGKDKAKKKAKKANKTKTRKG